MSDSDLEGKAAVRLSESVMKRMDELQTARGGYFEGGEWRISVTPAGPFTLVLLTSLAGDPFQLDCNVRMGQVDRLNCRAFSAEDPEAQAVEFLNRFFDPETGVKTEQELFDAQTAAAPLPTTGEETLGAGGADGTHVDTVAVLDEKPGALS